MFRIITTPRLFLLFILYSFLGWACEVFYVGIFFERKFVNRGFLHGPVCPIYGFGGLIVLHGLENWKGTWLELFFASAFFCSVLEYVSSWLLETLFKTKWWDYSDKKFNLHGRVCLLNSVLFGLMGVLCAHFVQPLFLAIVFSLSEKGARWCAAFIAVLLFADLSNTLRRLVGFSETMVKLREFKEELEERFSSESWFKKGGLNEMLLSIKERSKLHREQFSKRLLEKIEDARRRQKNAETLLRHFPSMTSKNYGASIALIKEMLREAAANKAKKHDRSASDAQ
ncbi:putative ABC transporter permease [Treponema parvum]|uniref:ABC transporter permease n=1 Tax=Treponema parvum TaxID=138851 RepID=A0A975F1X4_9SPIR|nr:putative ABC transporter permease [Treponema parvum]QTQ13076.1 putative ABC transporter permease [Treponema parvum]